MLANRSAWSLKISVWVERNGVKVLGPGRAELLNHIDHLHSISAAARQMSMSYRRAWSLVQAINEAAGEPLVEAVTGGSGGGGAALTTRGREALAEYQALVARL